MPRYARSVDEAEAKALLGANVAGFRAKAGLSQDALAKAVKVHVRHLKAVEAGSRAPSFSLLVRLAQVVEVEPHQLLKPSGLRRRGRGRPKKS